MYREEKYGEFYINAKIIQDRICLIHQKSMDPIDEGQEKKLLFFIKSWFLDIR